MVIGVGCDIIEIERIKKAVMRTAFVKRVYADCETAYCSSRGKQAAASFAARFAAKEAILKALGTGLRGGSLTEIVVTNDEFGKPQVELSGYHLALAQTQGVERINISLSHNQTMAVAYVVMEDGK